MKRVTIYGCVSAAVVLIFVAGMSSAWLMQPSPRPLTQKDIDAAVLHTLQTKSLPSRTARAAEAVRESVVEIRSFPLLAKAEEADAEPEAKGDQPAAPPGALPAVPPPATPQTNPSDATPPTPAPAWCS